MKLTTGNLHPGAMKEEREAFFRQGFPLAEGFHDGSGGLKNQFPVVEKLWGQSQQSLMWAVVVGQLGHLFEKSDKDLCHYSKVTMRRTCSPVPTSFGLYPHSCRQYSGFAISLSNSDTPRPKAPASLDFTIGPNWQGSPAKTIWVGKDRQTDRQTLDSFVLQTTSHSRGRTLMSYSTFPLHSSSTSRLRLFCCSSVKGFMFPSKSVLICSRVEQTAPLVISTFYMYLYM